MADELVENERRLVVRDVRFGSIATQEVLDDMQPGVEHVGLSKSMAAKARGQRMYVHLPQVRVPVSCDMPDGSSQRCLAEIRVRHENARFDEVASDAHLDVADGVVHGTGAMSFGRHHQYVVRMVDAETLDLVRDADGLPVVTQMSGLDVANMVKSQIHGGFSGEPCATVSMSDRILPKREGGDRRVQEGTVATRKSTVDVPEFVPDEPEPAYRGTVDGRLAAKVASVGDSGRVTSLLTEHLVRGVRRQYDIEAAGGSEPWGLMRFVATDKDRKRGYFEGDPTRTVQGGRILATSDATISYRLSLDLDHPAEDGSVPFEMRDCMSEVGIEGVATDADGNVFDVTGVVRMPWRPVSVGMSYAPGMDAKGDDGLACMGDLSLYMGRYARQYTALKRSVAAGEAAPEKLAELSEKVGAIAPETTVTDIGRGELAVSSTKARIYRFGDLPYDAELRDARLVQRGVENPRAIEVSSLSVGITGRQLKAASGGKVDLPFEESLIHVHGSVRDAERSFAKESSVEVGREAEKKAAPSMGGIRPVAAESEPDMQAGDAPGRV